MTAFPYVVPEGVIAAVERCERVLLGTHENPDADGMGSLLALGLALAERGRHVAIALDDELPERLVFLPGHDRLERPVEGERFDLGILFDCHRTDRLGGAARWMTVCDHTIAVDHHPVDDRGSDVDEAWIVPDAPATAMMVLSLLREMHDVPMGADKATCLYAGLLTDTGGFRHANTTHDALLAAADLVENGADPTEVSERMMHRRRREGLRLLGESLLDADYRLDGAFATMTVERTMLDRTGATMDETEGLVSYLTGVDGVRVAALIKEVGEGEWRVSLRSRDDVRVDEIARGFGGGGHHRAAAFTVEGMDRDALHDRLVDVVAEALERDGDTP